MITDKELKKYLRQNKPTKTGQPGSFYLRILYQPAKLLKAQRKDIGLGTNDLSEALGRARVLLQGCYALGARFTNKIAIAPRERKKKIVPVPSLWDWADTLPPQETDAISE